MIKAKWEEYLGSVTQRESKYIKGLENFIKDRDFETNFQVQNIAGISKLMEKYSRNDETPNV